MTLLLLGLLAAAGPEALAPSVTADLDGDGKPETVTATASRGDVRLEVRGANGAKRASAKAPAPAADVVHVTLTTAPIGSAGALLAVSASTDASECVSVWRLRGGTLAPLPVRRDGKDLPACGPPGRWTQKWEREAEGQPSRMVRERDAAVAQGNLRVREVFSFAGFSLDYDSGRSTSEINGVPIPAWYRATLYTRTALDRLYDRFNMAAVRSQPTLAVLTDPEHGVFALRFGGPGSPATAPVDAFAWTPSSGTASLSGKAADRTVHVALRLGGDGSVPFEARVEGLGAPLDGVYGPAGTWHGESRQVFPSAADEIASEDLVGLWDNGRGARETIAIEGEPPYRVRMGKATYAVDLESATPPLDLLLVPTDATGPAWGLVLRGPNGLERVPLACTGEEAARMCRPDGDRETLRRLGALVNVR